mgnify:CR=1 FL=1
MKKQWLNLVLRFTNLIYQRKQAIRGQTGIGVISNIGTLVLLEIFLGIISLPLYLSLRSKGVTAFFSEKGTYEKVSFDYNLRRVLTLTGVSIFALIWAIKLILILVLPSVYGPMQLYSVSDFNPSDILSKDLIASEIGIQSARVLSTMPQPKIMDIEKKRGGSYSFSGKSQPNVTVVLLLSDRQTAVYSADSDKNGDWTINHDQSAFNLKEGNHSVIVFSYDKRLGTRSEAGPEQFFKVTTSWLDSFTKNIDILANWSLVIVLALGVFLTLLTI